MEIKATQVKELRELSGVGMMECKKALVESSGDIQKALDLLRSNSALKAEKKSGRVAADGLLVSIVTDSYVTLVEINSETDFAAKDKQFLDFCELVCDKIQSNLFKNVEELSSILESNRQKLVQSIGENIQIRRLISSQFDDLNQMGLYVHSDNKLAAFSILKLPNADLARDISMHISAMNPLAISKDDIEQSIIEREKTIFEKQLADSDKPKEIQEKIIDGKLNKFFNENCLLGQSFVKDPDKSIDDLLKEQDNEILSFHRFKVGDGIDTATKDFAEEVAEQLK